MRRFVVGLVVSGMLSGNSVFAGDLREAAHVAAVEAAQAPVAGQRGPMPTGLKWTGIGLLIGGGLAILAGAALKGDDDACGYTAAPDECDAIGTGFYVAGAAMAGTGGVLLGVANAKRERLPSITFRRGRVAVQQRIGF